MVVVYVWIHISVNNTVSIYFVLNRLILNGLIFNIFDQNLPSILDILLEPGTLYTVIKVKNIVLFMISSDNITIVCKISLHM